MKKKITSIFLMANGNIAVFDEKKQQIPVLQKNPIVTVLKKAKKLGYDTKDAEIFLAAPGKKAEVVYDTNYRVITK